MTAPQKSAAILGLVLLAGFGVFKTAAIRQQRAEQAQAEAIQAAARASRPSPAVTAPSTPTPTPPSESPAPKAEPAPTPDQQVALLKQLLHELPAQDLPEIRLLNAEDWLDVAHRHSLESSADIRVALADVRAIARKKFGEILQNALRDYTTAAGGQLPDDLMQLASRLSPPAAADMLARYELTRTGKVGEPSEKLIREKKTSDMILSVGLDGWGLTNNSDLPPGFGETSDDALERVWRSLGTALGDDAKGLMAALPSPTALGAVMKGAFERLTPIYGNEDAFGDALKAAVKSFQGAHPEATLTDLAQVFPYLAQADKFADAMRPAFAQFAYLREHPGQPPADVAALQPYLARPFIATEALKEMKLTTDGEHLSLNYNWELKK
jgi:hypothetical protein